MTARALVVCSALLALGSGCFVAVPNENAPPYPAQQPAANPAPAPPASTAPAPGASVAETEIAATPTTPPAPAPPAPDPFAQLEFTPVLDWTISGNTPVVSWSPARSKLAVFSDPPRKPGAKDHKRHIDVVDVKTRKAKKLGPVGATVALPLWLDESTLIFLCTGERCGKGKNGVYSLKVTGGAPKQIFAINEHTEMALFATPEGRVLVRRHERPPPTSDGTREGMNRWEEWDPRTKKMKVREDLPLNTGVPPAGTAIVEAGCEEWFGQLDAFANDGKIGLRDRRSKTDQTHIIVEAPLLPVEESNSSYGHPPCFSPEGSYLVYYSLDKAKKQGKGTLLEVEGLPAKK